MGYNKRQTGRAFEIIIATSNSKKYKCEKYNGYGWYGMKRFYQAWFVWA